MAERVSFTVEATMEERWVPQFLGLLRRMEIDGQVGHSEVVRFFADGDGDFRPKFTWTADAEPAQPVDDGEGNEVFDAG